MSLPNRVKRKYQDNAEFRVLTDQICELVRSGKYTHEDIADMWLIVDLKKEVGQLMGDVRGNGSPIQIMPGIKKGE